MENELTNLETDWNNHMTVVNARLFDSPDRPVIVPSTTIEDGLRYLTTEINDLNFRCPPLARWGFAEEDGCPFDYDLLELLDDLAVETVGTESHLWRFKRTMAKIEIYLSLSSVVVAKAEAKTFERFEVFCNCFDMYWDEVVERHSSVNVVGCLKKRSRSIFSTQTREVRRRGGASGREMA
jgi:hypothetical protein